MVAVSPTRRIVRGERRGISPRSGGAPPAVHCRRASTGDSLEVPIVRAETTVTSPSGTLALQSRPGAEPTASNVLKPYVPRLVIDWLRRPPDALHREIDGSIVFVDISGFTALTERLARRGKIGAELMRDTLDGVFRALLDEAYDWGAGLLKWGGDALLLALRRARARARAPAAPRGRCSGRSTASGGSHVGGGTITLRMSVGIATGTFHFFMVGSVHRELLVAGPAMTETVEIEAIADAGEIGISRCSRAASTRRASARTRETSRCCSRPRPSASASGRRTSATSAASTSRRAFPIAARAHVLLERSEPEHRTITAAFIDLMDTDRLLGELGPLGARRGARRAAALRSRRRRSATRCPSTSRTSARAASRRCSRRARRRAPATTRSGCSVRCARSWISPGVVPMRIGVNTGKVFTGDFGPPYRRAYRVFGDAINTAARVMSKAEPGQILSTEIVLERSRTSFETTPIEPFAAKGKAEPVRASIVGPIVGTQGAPQREDRRSSAVRRSSTRCSSVLDDVARRQRAGSSRSSGQPGVGKSRLVEELIERSPDVRIVPRALRGVRGVDAVLSHSARRCATCSASRPSTHGRRSAGCEERVASRRRRTWLEWLPLLGVLLGLDLPHTDDTTRSRRALPARAARRRRDALPRRDASPDRRRCSSSRTSTSWTRRRDDLLLRLSTAGAETRHVLLVTHRDADTSSRRRHRRDAALVVALPAAARRSTRSIEIVAARHRRDPLPPHDVEEIARRSGGNALFLFELLDSRARDRDDGGAPRLGRVADRRRHRPPLADRPHGAALRRGARRELRPELLSTAVRRGGRPRRRACGRDSRTRRSRSSSGLLRFRNTLIRDAAYEGLPYRRRRELHERVGETIEARAGVHRRRGARDARTPLLRGTAMGQGVGVLPTKRRSARWGCTPTSTRRAPSRGRLSAARHLRRIGKPRDSPRSRSSSATSATASASSSAPTRRSEPHARSCRVPSAAAGRLALKQANPVARLGHYSRALKRISLALIHLGPVNGRAAAADRARLYTLYGWIRFCQGRPGETIDWCRRSVSRGAACARQGRARSGIPDPRRRLHGERRDREGRLTVSLRSSCTRSSAICGSRRAR